MTLLLLPGPAAAPTAAPASGIAEELRGVEAGPPEGAPGAPATGSGEGRLKGSPPEDPSPAPAGASASGCGCAGSCGPGAEEPEDGATILVSSIIIALVPVSGEPAEEFWPLSAGSAIGGELVSAKL